MLVMTLVGVLINIKEGRLVKMTDKAIGRANQI